ncbi:UNVERIFIED_CONTAM: hypothetical protein K2H54_018554 [Gekko kuhli]
MEIVSIPKARFDRQRTKKHTLNSVEKQVVVAIWYLVNTNTYCKVGEQFGLELSTVGEIALEVCFVLKLELYKRPSAWAMRLESLCEEKGHDVLLEHTDQDTLLVPEKEEHIVQAIKKDLADGKQSKA